MGIYEFFHKVIPKTVQPKIWSVILKDNDRGEMMHMCVAYTLEEATESAWTWLAKDEPGRGDVRKYSPRMWLSMNVEDIKKQMFNSELAEIKKTKVKAVEEKKVVSPMNQLINKIIEDHDVRLFEKSKKKLDENEIKYIEEKLKNI